jgi:hypothetical protein
MRGVVALVQFTVGGLLVAACDDSNAQGTSPPTSSGNSGGTPASPDVAVGSQSGNGGQQGLATGGGGGVNASSAGSGSASNLQADAGGHLDAGSDQGVVCVGTRFVGSEADYANLVAEQCREITEHLTISDATWPADAAGLDELTHIGGTLTVLHVTGLRSMIAFSHLRSVGTLIRIQENADLEALDGFESLTSVGSLEIAGNLALESVSGLSNLTTVNDMLLLRAPVKSLEGWQLKNVGSLSLVETALTAVTGLEHLTDIGGGLVIHDNSKLVSLSALSNLQSLGAGFWLTNNAVLESAEGLENLTSIVGSFQVTENAALASIESFLNWPADTVATELVIRDNPNLPQCQVDALTVAQDNATCAECTGNDGTCN